MKDPSELAAAIELAFEHGDKVMVEHRVFGVECSVAALGDGKTLRALPVVEIMMPQQSEFYDLEVKYADPNDIHRIRLSCPKMCTPRSRTLPAVHTRRSACSASLARDVIVTGDGPIILETNNIPGMTSESLVPDEARHAGIAFSDLCAELVELASSELLDERRCSGYAARDGCRGIARHAGGDCGALCDTRPTR
ncbi:MAG: hypothetical protein ACLTSX_04405 [Collinsella sp.]